MKVCCHKHHPWNAAQCQAIVSHVNRKPVLIPTFHNNKSNNETTITPTVTITITLNPKPNALGAFFFGFVVPCRPSALALRRDAPPGPRASHEMAEGFLGMVGITVGVRVGLRV